MQFLTCFQCHSHFSKLLTLHKWTLKECHYLNKRVAKETDRNYKKKPTFNIFLRGFEPDSKTQKLLQL